MRDLLVNGSLLALFVAGLIGVKSDTWVADAIVGLCAVFLVGFSALAVVGTLFPS